MENKFVKNGKCTVKIEDIGNDGEGIGRADGYTLFVKDAVIGDTVEAQIVKPKKNYAFARLSKVIVPSEDRIEPPCPVYRQCGGCQIQAVSYKAQLEFKTKKVRGNLQRIGGFAPELLEQVTEPMIGMDDPWRYRNKAQYPIGTDRNGMPTAGFYAGRTHDIIAEDDCLIGAEENKRILDVILKHMQTCRIKAYDETERTGLLRHVLIRNGRTSGEFMVCLIINRKITSAGTEYIPGQQELVRMLTEAVPEIKSISLNSNTEFTNVILGQTTVTIYGEDTITDTIHVLDPDNGYERTGEEVTFHISPQSFYQVNPVQTEKLYSTALEYAGLTGNETVWDLYCGIGTISLFLARHAKRVCGVEVIPQAIEDARRNAMENKIDNADFYVGKAEEILPEYYEEHEESGDALTHPDVIVVDPPRKGCDEICLQTMLRMRPDRIVYVSCDSATLARDLKILTDGGYELKRVRPCDQFPMTVHVETVCLLSKETSDVTGIF